MTQHTIGIEGMTCVNCALGIKKSLEKKGLQNVQVDFPNAEASFEMNGSVTFEEVQENIEGLGFKVLEAEADGTYEETSGWSALEWKVLICALLTLPLFLAMFLPIPLLHNTTVQLLLCLPVFIIGVVHFGISAFNSLKSGVPNMDVLIIIGSSAAFLYSLIGYAFNLGPAFVFWETSATIITLVLVGNLLEHRAVKRTTTAMRALQGLQAETAHLVTFDFETDKETITEIAYKDIKTGQYLLVKTGDKIPVDGRVVWGEGSVNEAMMTGESLLVDKTLKSNVIGGTILSLGTIKMQATKVGKQTALAQIIKLVKEAQANQPPIQKLADRVSAVFVPVVLLIAMATFGLGYGLFGIGAKQALLNSIAVLVVACPCAMGLATPTALMVGIGRAAKNGILLKGGITIETLSKVKNLVFDKTGTLTTGKFSIKEVQHDIPEADFKSILLGLEQYSTHPLAESIVGALAEEAIEPLKMAEVREMKGLGIMGKDEMGNTYMAGAHSMAAEFTDDNTHNIYLLKNGKLVGWLDLKDQIKPDAADCIAYLKANHIRTVLVSGDTEEKTHYIAHKVGIPEFYARKLPKEKLDMIDELSKNGLTAMVGDGINDAPALARAAVGISLSNASKVAIQSADVILLNGKLQYLNKAIGISKATVRTIRQNLFWAFFYNILAIPVAAMGFLNPMVAALAMALSDVFVIGNSLRLRGKKI